MSQRASLGWPFCGLRIRPQRLAYLNAAVLVAAVVGNTYFQVFCRPVPWALVVTGVCFVALALMPVWWASGRWPRLGGFAWGVGFCVLLYCHVFLEGIALLGVLLIPAFGLGFVLLGLLLLTAQAVYFGLIRPPHRIGFVGGVVVCVLVAAIATHDYRRAVSDVAGFSETEGSRQQSESWRWRADTVSYAGVGDGAPLTGYMRERILGIGFLYHTRVCYYDGWRPPLHDPLLNVAIRFSGGADPVTGATLRRRISLYRERYPGRPVKLDCACAREERERYHTDPILW